MINFSTFLLESRLDFLKKQHPEINSSHDSLAVHRSASDIIDHFATHADPTANKANTQWIISRYKDKDFRQEDHGRIRSALENFQKHKSKLAERNINKYKSLSDLEDAVEPHLGTVSRKQEKAQIKHEGADLIHDGENFMVHRLKTKEAACHYGKGTKWCTAADKNNKFDDYNVLGPLYVVTHKPSQEKHQFHFESGQFMDAKDRGIDLPKFVSENPELKEVREFRDKSPHFGRNEKEVHEIIDRNLGSDNEYISGDAIMHPFATSTHIDKALLPDYSHIRHHAIYHPRLNDQHISKILADNHEYSTNNQAAAILHQNASTKNINDALENHQHRDVKYAAIQNKNVNSENIWKALESSDSLIRRFAVQHERADRSHIMAGIKDDSFGVSEAARMVAKNRGYSL